MAKDNAHLLVIDHSPECAEEINSLLRNAGIEIRTKFAKTIEATEEAIKLSPPLLLLYNSSAPKSTPLVKILHLADQYQITAAVRFFPNDPSELISALDFFSCLAINQEEDEHLIKIVRTLLDSASSNVKNEELGNRLDELQSRYNLLLDSSRESIAYIHQGLHVYANRAYLQLLGAKDFKEIEVISLLDLMISEQCDLKNLLRDLNKGNFPTAATCVTLTGPGGNRAEVELVFSPARYEGESCIQMVVREVDANTVLKSELDLLRRMDQVTQLLNRNTFSDILEQQIAGQNHSSKIDAVFYIEADKLRELRAELGISGWDAFMVDFSRVLKSCIDERDIAARIDDNGFALMVSRENKSQLVNLGERIVTQVEKQISELAKYSSSVTCSIGIALMGSSVKNADVAINNARDAFLQASVQSNCVKLFKPQMKSTPATGGDQQWVERINYAMDNQEIYSVQQSIINLEGESETLFENKTFLREDNKSLSAEEFLPIAERNDLGSRIDRHVVQGLMSVMAGTGDQHIISLSANSLMDFSFPSWVSHQLEEIDVQGSQLIFQFSVEAVAANIKMAKRLVTELKTMGCRFALSSFDDKPNTCALLDQLDVSMVKLRPGLTADLSSNSTHQEIVRNVVLAAETRQVSVIADDIHDAADLAVLWQCGVKLVAGDLLNETTQVVG